jgi:lipopolysaccharide/colanic/teichoic acid biosynthesis glycosyltransferase
MIQQTTLDIELTDGMSGTERAVKRAFDIVAALFCLLLLSPLMLLIAVSLKIKDRGPVLFRQERIGYGAQPFYILKFRTMRTDTESDGRPQLAQTDDERLIPLGRFLRTHHLDELPQLVNILRGEMSFVGPRPDVPGYADQLKGDDRRVLKLRPGITGPATLKYRLEDEMISEYVAQKQAAGDKREMQEIAEEYNDQVIYPDKVRLNKYYLDHYSFIKDIQMIVCTVLGKKMRYAGEEI